MIRTQIYLPDELYKNAKAIAQLQNVSISQLIRVGLKLAIKKKTNKKSTGDWFLKNFVGKDKGKAGVEAALSHNDIYDI